MSAAAKDPCKKKPERFERALRLLWQNRYKLLWLAPSLGFADRQFTGAAPWTCQDLARHGGTEKRKAAWQGDLRRGSPPGRLREKISGASRPVADVIKGAHDAREGDSEKNRKAPQPAPGGAEQGGKLGNLAGLRRNEAEAAKANALCVCDGCARGSGTADEADVWVHSRLRQGEDRADSPGKRRSEGGCRRRRLAGDIEGASRELAARVPKHAVGSAAGKWQADELAGSSGGSAGF